MSYKSSMSVPAEMQANQLENLPTTELGFTAMESVVFSACE